MDDQSVDENRALDAQCAGSRRSGPFRATVSMLKALPPEGKALCIYKYAAENLPHLVRCALAAGITADTRSVLGGGGEPIMPVLCIAAMAGSERALEALLVGRANVALTGSKGWTAVHFAANYGHVPCLRMLLGAGAPKEAMTEEGLTPLHCAAQKGHAECCSVLLASGCDVDARSHQQSTPLVCAARNGSLSTVQLLLARGANSNAVDDSGSTPLILALLIQHTPSARELLPVSDLHVTNQQGWNALHISIITGNMECFELLLPLVSDVDVRTVQGIQPDGSQIVVFNQTPLHLACILRMHIMTRNLMRRGASRSARDSEQLTPLQRAARLGDMGCVAMLLGEPARNRLTPDEVNSADYHGCTALHLAAHGSHARICGVLLAAGASLDAVDSDGKTPLMVAQQQHPVQTMLLELLSGRGPVHPPGSVCDCCGITEAETRLYTCTGCFMTRYCGRDCLRAAWQAHKEECGRLKAACVVGDSL